MLFKDGDINMGLQFSHSVMSDSLQSHGMQLARLPCPSPTPRAYLNSYPSSWWCHPTISSSVIAFSSCLQSCLALVFSGKWVLRIRWPKYWSFSFSISPSVRRVYAPQFLSCHNKDLEWRTLKPPWRVTALGSWTDHVIALRQSVLQLNFI